MKKSEWGPIVWNLLHCIACKIKPIYFENEEKNMLNIIKGICANLPCPTCAMHSTSILRKYSPKVLKSREDLKQLILMLHNVVNKKLKKDIYTLEMLEMYDSKVFRTVLIDYYVMMKQNKYSEKMMLNNFHKNAFIKRFYKYFTMNMIKFNE